MTYITPTTTTYGLYAALPVGWDGAEQLVYTSSTNNCRYYGVPVTPDGTMSFLETSGFTTTTTSNNSYPGGNLPFVRPGIVPTLQHDQSAGNLYSVVMLGIEGTTVTKLSTTPFPSQTFSNGGFLRGITGYNDNPVLHFYGNASTTHTCWTATVDAAGGLSAITSVGTFVRSPAITSVFGVPYSDRLSFVQNHWVAFDRLAPTVPIVLTTKLPATSGMDAQFDRYFAEATNAPGRLFVARKATNSTGAATKVVDAHSTADGATLTIEGEWAGPNLSTFGRIPLVTALADGTVVALAQPTEPGPAHVYYDIFGTPENLGPLGTQVPQGISPHSNGFVAYVPISLTNYHHSAAWVDLGPGGVLIEPFESGSAGASVTNVNTTIDALSNYSDPYDPSWSGAEFTSVGPHSGLLCVTGKSGSTEMFNHPYQDDESQHITANVIDDYWWHKWHEGAGTGAAYHWSMTTGQIGNERTSGYDYEPLMLWYNTGVGWHLQVSSPEPGGTPSSVDYPIALPEDAWNKFRVVSNASGDLSFTVTNAAGGAVFSWSEAGFLHNPTHFTGDQYLGFHTWRVFNNANSQTWLDDINVVTGTGGNGNGNGGEPDYGVIQALMQDAELRQTDEPA